MEREWPLVEAFKSNSLDDVLWALRCLPEYNALWRKYAIWCAKQVDHLLTDQRSEDALEVAWMHSNGQTTEAELAAARDAAWDAAWATRVAAWDAKDTASDTELAAAESARDAASAAAWSLASATIAGAAARNAARAASDASYAACPAARTAAKAAQKEKLREILAAGESEANFMLSELWNKQESEK